MNFGLVDPSFSTGNVQSGPNSVIGILIGAQGALQFPDGSQVIGTNTVEFDRLRHGERRIRQHRRGAGRQALPGQRAPRPSRRHLRPGWPVLRRHPVQSGWRSADPADPADPTDSAASAGSHRRQHQHRADFAAGERYCGHESQHGAQDLRARHQQPDWFGRQRLGRQQLARRPEGRRSGWRFAPTRQRGRGLRARPAAERHAADQRDALPQRRGRVPARRPSLRPGAREPPEPARAAGAVPGRHRPARPQGAAPQAAQRRHRAQHHRGAREEGRELRRAAGLPVRAYAGPRAGACAGRHQPQGRTRRSTSSTSSDCPKRI